MGTINDKLTYLNTTKSQLKSMLQYANPTVTDSTLLKDYYKSLFDAYINILNNPDSVWNNLPKISGNGTQITLNNTVNAPMRITLNPTAISQTTYTGKNLFDKSVLVIGSCSYGEVGSAAVYNESATNRFTIKPDNAIEVEPNTTYTFSMNYSGAYALAQLTSSKVNLGDTGWEQASTLPYTFTTNANTKYIAFNFQKSSVTTMEIIKTYEYQLEKSSQATTYEPYVGGTASPNPSYPQDIYTISGDNNVVIEGKNLFNGSLVYQDQTLNGVTLKNNGDGSFTITGTATADFEFKTNIISGADLTTKATKLPAGTYRQQMASRLQLYDKNYNWVTNTWSEFTTTQELYVRNAFFTISNGTTYNTTYWYQIEKGNTKTSYVPYQEPQTSPINLPIENLFDINNSTASLNCTKNDNIYTSSALSSYNVIAINLGTNISLKNGQDYYISYDVKTNSGDTKNFSYFGRLTDNTNYTSYGELVDTFNMSNLYQRVIYKTTPSADFNASSLLIQANGSITNAQMVSIANIQISTKIGSYTPYETTPIEYCKIGNYEDEFILTSGKNIFSTDFKTSDDFTTYTQINSNSFSFTCSGTWKQALYIIPCEKNTDYFLSYDETTNLSGNHTYCGIRGGQTNENLMNLYHGYFTSFNSGENTSLRIAISTGNNGSITSGTISNIQLEKGTSASNFEPYGTNQWYLKKNIGKVVLDGSESWLMSITSRFYITLDRLTGNTLGYCNYFENKPSLSTNNGITFYQTNQNIYIYYDGCTTTTNFKTWLGTHNTIIYYVLATPTYTQITGTLETQLNNIYEKLLSYKGTTNISQVNNDLPFVLGVSAIKEL